ncbi:MAG: 3-deoxy-D-manno-octulosonic acid transferase [Acetobacteraceae bacterium]
MTAARLVWSTATTAASPLLRLLLWRRAGRGKEERGRLAERRGAGGGEGPVGRILWLHAASVGEAVSVLPVLAELLRQDGGVGVVLTTGTVTSARLVAGRIAAEGWGERVVHRFAPLDVPRWVARFLDHWRPVVAGFVESEIWPNRLVACQRRGIPVLVLNGRLSARSFARWRRVPGLARELLGTVAVAAQSDADAARFRALGAGQVTMPGNLKLAAPALAADPAELGRLRALLAGRPVWVAASTHPGEEALVLAAHRALAPDWSGLVTIVAPRHPERGAEVAAAMTGAAVTRRGAGEDPPPGGVWVADTLGELGLWYRLAPVVVVGRSLLPPGGGQNPYEPARLGCAVATGPLVANFEGPVADLRAAGALEVVADAAALARFVAAMLADPAVRAAMGARAAAAARGADALPGQLAAALLAGRL